MIVFGTFFSSGMYRILAFKNAKNNMPENKPAFIIAIKQRLSNMF